MGLFRVFLYGSLVTATFVGLHFADLEEYEPVRQHPLYKDFVTPYMTQLKDHAVPLWNEVISHPQIAAWLGLEVPESSSGGTQGKGVVARSEDEASGNTRLHELLVMPSQMGFSLVQLGEKLKKRSVLSTEGSESTYFEMPDGSRLWLQHDSIVEVGWTDKDGGKSELLLRVERGMMHIERPGGATGSVYLVTNSGIRYALAAGDGWMATAQMGPIDKGAFPDAESKMSGRWMDYVRRATLAEARELAKLLKTDGRRETMLYQDQLRIAADDEDRRRKSLMKDDIMPVDVVSIPLEIPNRRGGRDLSIEPAPNRMPASVASAKMASFPVRGPASVSSLDEGTRIASEARILKLSESGKCSEAKKLFGRLRDEHKLSDSDAWVLRINQNFSQRCP